MNILILDDDPDMLALYQTYLKAPDFTLKCVQNKKDFMNAFSSSPFDACFVDVNLGEELEDGFTVVKELRRMFQLKTPIIIVSKNQEREKIAHGLECGADDYVTKPLDADILKAKLKYLLTNPAFKKLEVLETLQLVKVPASISATVLSLEFDLHSLSEDGPVIETGTYISKNTMVSLSGEIIKEIWGDENKKFEVRRTEVIDGKYRLLMEYIDDLEENAQKARNWIMAQKAR